MKIRWSSQDKVNYISLSEQNINPLVRLLRKTTNYCIAATTTTTSTSAGFRERNMFGVASSSSRRTGRRAFTLRLTRFISPENNYSRRNCKISFIAVIPDDVVKLLYWSYAKYRYLCRVSSVSFFFFVDDIRLLRCL